MIIKKKILVIFGTRPEAIKLSSLIKFLKLNNKHFSVKVCITAQHRHMLDQVLNIFDIKPDYDLNIMKKNQNLYEVTSKVLLGLRDVLKTIKPDLVFLQGDTTTVMSASLACYYEKIKVGHIEAGLRTGKIYSPWPEEINRKIATQIASYHFAPTELSKNNLICENVNESRILVTGNTVIDALYDVKNNILKKPYVLKNILNILSEINIHHIINKEDAKYILVTCHRRENFGQGFDNICEALKCIAKLNNNIDIIFPVHLNPNIQTVVKAKLVNIKNIHIVPPLDYLPFIFIMDKAYIIMTDSGGIQEEAPSLGKPVLVLRDTTERPEAVSAGTVKIIGTDKANIIAETQKLINNKSIYTNMSSAENPYGDGNSAELIVNFIKNINDI